MTRRLLPALTLLALTQGCLVIYGDTEFVRLEEKREAYAFENHSAWRMFHELLVENEPDSDSDIGLVVPLLFMYTSRVQYSQNALFNDHAASCDADGNEILTLAEVREYREILAGGGGAKKPAAEKPGKSAPTGTDSTKPEEEGS